MENTWMPKVAGILDIVAGSFGIILSCMMVLWLGFFYFIAGIDPAGFHNFPIRFMALFFIPWAIFMLAAGILAIVGGIYALRKQKWGLALAGSIGAFFGSSHLGVAAIIFTALSKNQFE
jgi:hypothetical protein